jgi:type IV pilus assembly protein PilB
MRFERTSNKHLGELLIERGVITRVQLDAAIEYQKNNKGVLFGEALIRLGNATEEDIAQALTCQYGFPYLPLSNYEIDIEILAAVPVHMCEQFCLIPIDKIGKSLTLAMSNPLNIRAVEDVELLSGCTVQAFVSTASDIRNAIKKYYGPA